MHQIPAISPNMIIIAVLLVAGGYGLFAGKQRLRLLILSVYVGIVLAEELATVAKPYVPMLGADQLALILLGLPILIFGFAGQRGGHDKKGSAIANAIVGFLTGGLIVASALRLLPTSEMAGIDGDSFIAMVLQQYQLILIGALPLVALLLGLMKAKDKKH